jgi:ABC-type taurine transport system ATPase subunit
MSDVVISATGVERTFVSRGHAVHALGPVDLTVERGQFVAIVGPSGCGKSTLLRIVAGLAAPSAGEIVIDRADADSPLCSMVFQDYGIFPWKTVLANVRLPLDIAGVSRPRANEVARDWIERAGVAGFESAYPAHHPVRHPRHRRGAAAGRPRRRHVLSARAHPRRHRGPVRPAAHPRRAFGGRVRRPRRPHLAAPER